MSKETFDSFLLETGLYVPMEFKQEDYKELAGIFEVTERYSPSTYIFDGYCPFCEKQSVFSILPTEQFNQLEHAGLHNKRKQVSAICSRDQQHELYFWLMTNKNTIIKIGQYPSVKEVSSENIRRYKKSLKKDYIELQTAIQLNANGVGIGAFVYLRRIFENLILKAYEENVEAIAIDDFIKMRMDEKIGLVRNHIPNFIVENKEIYGVLSKGIHELDENECLQFFSVLEESIEMILDEQLTLKQKKENESLLSKSISGIVSLIKNK